MRSTENHIKDGCHYYVHTPSSTANELFFYPVILGKFDYEPGYSIHRSSFDSFLLMLIEDGVCDLNIQGKKMTATKGSCVLLDCYADHGYSTKVGWSALWVHFDGPMARKYYDYIAREYGNVIIPSRYSEIHYEIGSLYRSFREHAPMDEAGAHKAINSALSEILREARQKDTKNTTSIQSVLTFIGNHFSEPLRLEDLAQAASLSPYYFTRLFTKETGLTPHQYLIQTRLSSAKYLLVSSDQSIKQIAFATGFNDESSFCYAFKKYIGITPTAYRQNNRS